MTRVLALTKYGREAASTRQRLLQFLPALEAAGFSIEVQSLLEDAYVRAMVTGEPYPRNRLLRAYADRFRALRRAGAYDLLWVYAELFPGLPTIFERSLLPSGVPLIYDCDDAFFHDHEQRWWTREKLRPLIFGASAITAGNAYLADHVARWNGNVRIVPTVVDTTVYVPTPRFGEPPVIGWIGSPSTWSYVRPILPLLAEACAGGRARFLAVGAGRAAESDRFDGLDLRDWSEATEIADVQAMDIGIMPLPDEPWARGKCGYKLIQYMACGLPTIASPVGVNSAIVRDGATGFLVSSGDEWRQALASLIDNPATRVRLGDAGRECIIADYSLAVWAPRVVDLFRTVSAG